MENYTYLLLREFWISELFVAESGVRVRMSRAAIDVGAFSWLAFSVGTMDSDHGELTDEKHSDVRPLEASC